MLHKMVFYGLMFLVVFTALAFGATETWSVTVMALTVLLLVSAYSSRLILSGSLHIPAPGLLGLFLGFTLLVFLQTVPVPSRIHSFTFFAFTRPTLSVDPYATLMAATKVLCYGMIFFLVSHFFSAAGATMADAYARVFRFVHALIFFSFALAVFAIIQHFTFNGRIYWLKELTWGGFPFGPFVNRNHYAGYMELTIPLIMGLVFARGIPAERWPLYLFMSGIMAASLFLSLSRMGMISLLCQLPLLIFLLRVTKRHRLLDVRSLLALGLMVSLLLVFVFWFGSEHLTKRVGTLVTHRPEQLYPGRADVWQDTLRIFEDFPIAGSGLGTFPAMHAIYKSRPTDAVYLEAHNDYLQILSETGVLGAALLFLFGAGAVARALRLIHRERDPALLGLRIGALTGCFGLLLHSLTDFNLQIPANALLFFILAGWATMPGLGKTLARKAPAGASPAGNV